jgi:hypothetical protein
MEGLYVCVLSERIVETRKYQRPKFPFRVQGRLCFKKLVSINTMQFLYICRLVLVNSKSKICNRKSTISLGVFGFDSIGL